MASNSVGVRLKAVHRIEAEKGAVAPGEVFRLPEGEEAERLLRLGAAIVAEEEVVPEP